MSVSHETKITELEAIRDMVCQATGVTWISMQSCRKSRDVTEARVIFSQMAHDLGYHPKVIGEFMNKDLTTIIKQLGKK